MSRISDTRLRTREAAARLMAAGRRPYELTVDLIYAEIKQGSRTTINDELKLWKDEQTRVDALTAALPPAVANAMINIWAVALEYGEKVFDQHREEVETQLVQATTCIESLQSDKDHLAQKIEGLQTDVARGQSDLDSSRELLAHERTNKDAAVSRANALEQQLESTKADAALAISTLKAEQQQRIEELQATISSQERSFRQEIDKATERLEGVQKHVMLQVTEAREAQKRAEAQLSKACQKNEQLLAEAQEIRHQIGSLTQTSERAQTDLARAHDEMNRLQSGREALVQQIATATGKLGALGEQIESLERRAVGAETRLEDALKWSVAAKRKAEKPPRRT